MRRIICATRGSEVSRRTQETAIELAQEGPAELIFLYVLDATPFCENRQGLSAEIEEELERMGRSLLHIARARAKEAGVEAQIMLSKGKLNEAIKRCLKEKEAATLVIGAPRGETQKQAFAAEDIETFAREIREEMGIEVIIVN